MVRNTRNIDRKRAGERESEREREREKRARERVEKREEKRGTGYGVDIRQVSLVQNFSITRGSARSPKSRGRVSAWSVCVWVVVCG